MRKCKWQVAFAGTTHLNHHRLVISGEGQEDTGRLTLWVTVQRTPNTELLVPTLGSTELEKWQEGESLNYEASSSLPRTRQPLPSRIGCKKKKKKKNLQKIKQKTHHKLEMIGTFFSYGFLNIVLITIWKTILVSLYWYKSVYVHLIYKTLHTIQVEEE